jgi:hypothetical protein
MAPKLLCIYAKIGKLVTTKGLNCYSKSLAQLWGKKAQSELL